MALSKDHWQELLATADKARPKFRRVLHDAVEAALATLTVRRVADALNAGDLQALELVIDWEAFHHALGGYKPLIEGVFGKSGDVTAAWLEEGLNASFRFDRYNPHAVEWINRHSLELVEDLSSSSREVIRGVLRDGFTEGITPQQMARQIEQHIGLDLRRSGALEKYRDGLVEGDVPLADVDRLAGKYSERLLGDRAETIALEETLEASAQGNFESTRQSVERGVLDPDLYEAYRIVTPDDRLCEFCEKNDSEPRQLPAGTYASSGETNPRLHTRCRCCEGIRRKPGD